MMSEKKFGQRRFVIAACFFLSVYGAPQCQAQTTGYPSFGFHSYCNTGNVNYNGGITGYPATNSFNSGFAGLSQTSNGMVYSTQRSTQAAHDLAREVTNIWSRVWAGTVNQAQRMVPQMQQGLSQPAASMDGLLPPMTKQEMLRTFMEGGMPQGGGPQAAAPSAGSSQATSVAYSNYQTAENEARKAYNAAQRVRYYDKDTWSRKDDASNAEYAANNANYAAQRAESAAYNGDAQARGYAGRARDAANRARQDANQARYNADTMR
jgi:hypothetical protein